MSRLEVRAFDAAHVPEAAALLAERHRRHRMAHPLLPARYENPSETAGQLAEALAGDDASGAIALRDGRVIGYLLGAPKTGPTWGRNTWVEAAGQAATEAEVMRDLYAVAATRWVDEGRTAQYVLVPASDAALVQAWFRLGFGHQHSHGLRDAPVTPAAPPAAVLVRRATRADLPVLARLDLELPRHQSLAPTFSSGAVPSYEDSLAEWTADIDSAEYTTFVAEHNSKIIGSAIGCALEKSSSHTGLARPDRAGFLGFAAVFPHARGLGAGRALGEAVLAWAAENGMRCVVTDWRETNLLSSRAWPALGFARVFLRLHRLIGR